MISISTSPPVALMLALLLPAAAAQEESGPVSAIYRNTFQGNNLAGWSTVVRDRSRQKGIGVSTTPDRTEKVLGEFGNQTVHLDLEGLPPHDSITLSFDLLIIRSWDGNDARYGPDIWRLAVDGKETLKTSFSNTTSPQSYPARYPASRRPRAAAAAVNCYGYTWALSGIFDGPMDAAYRITRTLPHTGKSVRLSFGASLVDPDEILANESWALDDVVVTVQEATRPPQVKVEESTVDTVVVEPLPTPVYTGAP